MCVLHGQGHTAVCRAKKSLLALFLVIPDVCLEGEEETTDFPKEALQPHADAIEAFWEIHERAPVTVAVVAGMGRVVSQATVWDSGVEYSVSDGWPESSS